MKPGDEWRDSVLEMAMMLPDFLSIMLGNTAWQLKNIDLSSPQSFASNSFQENCMKGFTGKPIAALLTRRSTGPRLFSTSPTINRTCSSLRTSALTGYALPPAFTISSTTAIAALSLWK